MSGAFPGSDHRQRSDYEPGAPPTPSTSSSRPPPTWSPGQSFYFGGSAAPGSISHARAAPSRAPRPPQPQWTEYRDPRERRDELKPRVLLREGVCVCCEGRVGYPRDDRAFKCGTCETVTDLKVIGTNGCTAPPPYCARFGS